MSFHSVEPEAVLKDLGSSPSGLSNEEAKSRLEKYGPNIISGKHRRTVFDILVDQLKNFLLWLLITAASISFLIGHTDDAIAISFAIVLSIAFGFILEYKADESLRALKSLQSQKAVIFREGKTQVVESSEVVPGDILILEDGIGISADARLIKEYGLATNEAPLTGESEAVPKSTRPVEESATIHERTCMVYAGTFVSKGSGEAVVVATADRTEIGQIAHKLSEIESGETLLHKSLDDLGKKVSILSLILILVFFSVGFIQKQDPADLFVLSVSLAVAAVPEGLLTVLTIILSIGVKRMAESKALVRKLSVVENLGNATYIVVDKTGTLTEGKLSLSKIFHSNSVYSSSEFSNPKFLEYASLCTSAKLSEKGPIGDEVDKAILEFAASSLNVHKLKKIEPTALFPFDSDKKYMAGIFPLEKKTAIIKGAPEIILNYCSKMQLDGSEAPLTKEYKTYINASLLDFTQSGMRVVALAYKYTKSAKIDDLESDLTFMGLLAFQDPPRLNVESILSSCKNAGINLLMLTGDNINTAVSIATQVGILTDKSEAAEWKSLESLSKEELDQKLKSLKVIARSTPLSKLKIVEHLISRGESVVVTGDGVNDALALKKAQVGVVMGSGTEVSKEAGSLVLLDDNLSTLVSAVAYGRSVFSNILDFIRFQFTTNASILLMFILSFFAGLPYLLTPIQILFTNIVMDGPPALALGLEKASPDVLNQKPRKSKHILSKNLTLSILSSAIFMVAVSVFIYLHFNSVYGEKIALTATFVCFVLLQLFNSFNCRFARDPFFTNLSSNPYLLLSFFSMFALLLLVIYYEPVQHLFHAVPLSGAQLAYIMVASSLILAFEELKKKFFGNYLLY